MYKFSSKPENIQVLEDLVDEWIQKYHLQSELKCNILVSLTEAVNNAIIHGNQNDEKKNVYVKAHKEKDHLKVVVQDEGNGFDPKTVPDPTAENNIDCCGGRGVFLIKQLSQEVRYKKNGSCVELSFLINS